VTHCQPDPAPWGKPVFSRTWNTPDFSDLLPSSQILFIQESTMTSLKSYCIAHPLGTLWTFLGLIAAPAGYAILRREHFYASADVDVRIAAVLSVLSLLLAVLIYPKEALLKIEPHWLICSLALFLGFFFGGLQVLYS